MEWLDRFNNALDYLEANLDGEIDMGEAARIAMCSPFHFQRMFCYIAGIPLSEYLRRRRMTLAAAELAGGAKVLDVALRYGYESPTAFNRAYQSVHGAPPSAAKAEGAQLTAFPRISFTLSVKGEAAMNYRLVNLGAFRIVGFKQTFSMNVEESFQKVPLFWGECAPRIPEVARLMGGKPPIGLLGVSTCSGGAETFDYYIAVATDAPAPEGMCEYTVPASLWAVFGCESGAPGDIQELEKRIVTDWLPSSGYEYADAPDIELYGDPSNPHNEVWLPIIKKAKETEK